MADRVAVTDGQVTVEVAEVDNVGVAITVHAPMTFVHFQVAGRVDLASLRVAMREALAAFEEVAYGD